MQAMRDQDTGRITESLKVLTGSHKCSCGRVISGNKEKCFACLSIQYQEDVRTK